MSGANPTGHLRLQLAPAPAFAALIVTVHAAAAACVWPLLPGAWGTALAVLLLALGIASGWDRGLLAARVSPRAIELAPANALVLEFADRSRRPAAIGSDRWVWRHCVALPMRTPWRRTLLVTTGMLDEESFRLLRLWALWGRVSGQPRIPLPA